MNHIELGAAVLSGVLVLAGGLVLTAVALCAAARWADDRAREMRWRARQAERDRELEK